jgi:hypothetical protein
VDFEASTSKGIHMHKSRFSEAQIVGILKEPRLARKPAICAASAVLATPTKWTRM